MFGGGGKKNVNCKPSSPREQDNASQARESNTQKTKKLQRKNKEPHNNATER